MVFRCLVACGLLVACGDNKPPPVTVDDVTLTTSEDTPVTFAPPAVIAVAPTPGTHGTVSLADGVITYTPESNFNGAADFVYTISDGVDEVVRVTVSPVDDAPLAAADVVTVAQDSTANPLDVIANDPDIDSGMNVIAAITVPPSHGVVTIAAGGATVSYVPAAGYCNAYGTIRDTFTYAVSPGGSAAAVTVTVTCTPADSYAQTVLATPGLVSFWRLGESSGTVAADAHGTHPGTYAGGFALGLPGAVERDPDTAASFTGTAEVATSFVPGSAGTIEFWGYATDIAGRSASLVSSGALVSHQVGVVADGSVRVVMRDTAPKTFTTTKGRINVNEWHHYALTWESNVNAALYLDGQLVGSVALGATLAGGVFSIGKAGASGSGIDQPWLGRLDEVAIYDVALNAAVIKRHYQTGPEIVVDPDLSPHFRADVTDYVSRCAPGVPVDVVVNGFPGEQVAVDGGASRHGTSRTAVVASDGQGFVFSVIRNDGPPSTYHVRCLPEDFPSFNAQRFGQPQAEWYVVAPTLGTGNFQRYVAIFDDHGVPVWWMRSVDQPIDAKLLPNGNVAWLHVDLPDFEERSIDGTLIRSFPTVGAGGDWHDMQLLANGNYLLAKYQAKAGYDFQFCGGPATGTIIDAVVQELTPSGALVWEWAATDHIPPTEMTAPWRAQYCTRPVVDVYHFNAVEVDGDGLVMSFRHLDAIVRIHKASGAVTWKLGGTVRAESLAFGSNFGGQHDSRILADGTLTVHDNGTGRGRRPRAVRYQIDTVARTATLLEQVEDAAAPSSPCCGSSRKLTSGNWVSAWGGVGHFTEQTPAGAPVLRVTWTNPGLFTYRAHPIEAGIVSASALRAGMTTMHPRP